MSRATTADGLCQASEVNKKQSPGGGIKPHAATLRGAKRGLNRRDSEASFRHDRYELCLQLFTEIAVQIGL